MRFERAGIALEPRSIGGCIDLALVFFGRRLAQCLLLIAVFAIPAGVATYYAARYTSYGLLWAAGIFALASAPLGVCLVVAATQTAFAESWHVGRVLWEGLVRQPKAVWLTCLLRPVEAVLTAACLMPGVALAVYCGFLAESGVLRPWRRHQHDHRTHDLVQEEFSDLFVRGMMVWAFGILAWMILTITVDFASTLLFGVPLLFGRIAEALRNPWGPPEFTDVMQSLFQFCTTDAVALCTMTATALVVYAVCRLAWFFAYVDLRIRRDCWDLEVALAEEARRWEAVA
jgi:hypothetical protein